MAIFSFKMIGSCSNLEHVFTVWCSFRIRHFFAVFYENGVQGASQNGQNVSFRGQFSTFFYFKLVSIQNYRHQTKVAFWDFHTKHSHSFYGVFDFLPRPLFTRGFGTWPRPFFSKARGAAAPLRTPQEYVFAGGRARKMTNFLAQHSQSQSCQF